MPGYEKFTLKMFQEKLANGAYSGLSGCNRAIGRMSSWSEAERNKAKALAVSHFGGVEAPAKPDKAAKAAKPDKAAKPVKGVRGRRKIGAAPVVPRAETEPVNAPVKGRIRRDVRAVRKAVPPVSNDAIDLANRFGDAIHHRLETMQLTRMLGAPQEEVAEGARKAQQALVRVVETLSASVASLLSGDAQSGPSQAEVRAAQAFKVAALASNGAGPQSFQHTSVPAVEEDFQYEDS